MTVTDLWLAILASGIATHILCTLAWMAMPHHKKEWAGLPNEDSLHKTFTESVPPGQYVFPFVADHKQCNDPAYKQKVEACSGMLVIWHGSTNMGKAIGLTLLFFLVTAFVIGYLASLALPRGADFMHVFRFVTTAGLLAHVAGKFPGVFWFRRKVAIDVVDAVVFALATGAIFAALWPK